MGLFKKEKKFSIEDIRTISSIVEEKKGKRSSPNDFFEQMSRYKDFEKKMLNEKDIEIAEIIKNYGSNPDEVGEASPIEDEAIKQIIPFLTKAFNKNPQKPPNSATSPQEDTQTPLNKKEDILTSPELVTMAKSQLFHLMPKKYKNKLKEELSQLSERDIINLKRSIENDTD